MRGRGEKLFPKLAGDGVEGGKSYLALFSDRKLGGEWYCTKSKPGEAVPGAVGCCLGEA